GDKDGKRKQAKNHDVRLDDSCITGGLFGINGVKAAISSAAVPAAGAQASRACAGLPIIATTIDCLMENGANAALRLFQPLQHFGQRWSLAIHQDADAINLGAG